MTLSNLFGLKVIGTKKHMLGNMYLADVKQKLNKEEITAFVALVKNILNDNTSEDINDILSTYLGIFGEAIPVEDIPDKVTLAMATLANLDNAIKKKLFVEIMTVDYNYCNRKYDKDFYNQLTTLWNLDKNVFETLQDIFAKIEVAFEAVYSAKLDIDRFVEGNEDFNGKISVAEIFVLPAILNKKR